MAMAHVRTYELDPYATRLETRVVATGEDGPPFAVLADTILYPEGGGQPADHGWINDVEVVDVCKRDDEIRHFLSRPVPVGPALVRLDWNRRYDHMQQHTAQHLLTALAQDRFGWATTAFHLGTELSDVELDTPRLTGAALADLEEAVAAEVRAAREVTARRGAAETVAELAVRTRGLPQGYEGDVRLVEIAGVDVNTCGGTHVRSTAELEAVKLLHTESIRGGTRLYFVAGRRLRRRLSRHERRTAELRAALGAADDDLIEVAGLRSEQVKALERRVRGLAEALAAALAETLAGRRGSVVEEHFVGYDMPFLNALAREITRRAPGKALLLTSETDAAILFVVAAGDAVEVDVPAAGREIAAILDGRGGGAGRSFQGKAATLSRRADALAALHAAVERS
jgi:Ser-tRNA(Ala) deacylase AlaX